MLAIFLILSVFCSYRSVQSLLNQLRAIFDQIIEFQSAQDSLYRSALEELTLRLQYEERKKQREAEVRSAGECRGGDKVSGSLIKKSGLLGTL